MTAYWGNVITRNSVPSMFEKTDSHLDLWSLAMYMQDHVAFYTQAKLIKDDEMQASLVFVLAASW